MTEKPLHVQVAEALGWTNIRHYWESEPALKAEHPEPHFGIKPEGGQDNIPRYDTDWSATGPLIERLRIKLRPAAGGCWAASRPDDIVPPGHEQEENRQKLLIAVCHLILALFAAGKLK